MEKFWSFMLIIMLVVTPLTFITLRILFKKSLMFRIGLIIIFLLDTIGLLSFLNAVVGIKTMSFMGPIGVSLVIGGFYLIARNVKKLNIVSQKILSFAEGNVNISVDNEISSRPDEIGRIAQALNKLIGDQKEILGSIKDTSTEVYSASNEMSNIAETLSQSSSEQAASTEEISASMEQIAAHIQQNLENVRDTEKLSQKASEEILKSLKAVNDTVEMMRVIADKVKAISDIAFQTNLLALNAGVEANQAGEAGQGFAVIAGEVRSLAERSQLVAKEITELSDKGFELAANSGEQINSVVPEIQKTSQLVQEIAASSLEQTSGADQINNAIQQLRDMANENAASAEEMSGRISSLSDQAGELESVVGFYKLK